jgi:gamma-butyrobetaine dioxygenase/trimethyllysine dioxygenase
MDRTQIAAMTASPARLEIVWSDDHVSLFPSVWLRAACTCAQCGSTETAVRHLRLTELPDRPLISSAAVDGAHVVVLWAETHTSRFDAGWLRAHCLSETERRRRKPVPTIWSGGMGDRLPYLAYAEVTANPDTHLAFLETIRDLGFVILDGVPSGREHAETVGALIGKLRLTNYGIFELAFKPNPEIVGDMAVPLALHTDEPYRVEPPAITFFHVIQQSDLGGDSTLADGLFLAKTLRSQNPEAFEVLCRVPARFHRTLREGRAFENKAPIISRDRDGDVTGIRILDRGMAPLDADIADVEPFYDAVRALLRLIYDGTGQITVRLEPGQVLVFNNQRLMHGRTGFDPSQSRREVRSYHVDLDEFHSRLRVAYAARGSENVWMDLGAGTHV